MVRYRRNFVPGGTYFFTATLSDRRSSALTDHIDKLRTSFRAVRLKHPFDVDAIVVLPDHLHVVMTLPEGDARYSMRWQLIKRGFTDALTKAGHQGPRRTNGEFAIWQRRFWEHTIRDERDFEGHVDYVHFNPVKHGLVTRVRDWRYSSFHRYVRGEILPEDWAGVSSTIQFGEFGER